MAFLPIILDLSKQLTPAALLEKTFTEELLIKPARAAGLLDEQTLKVIRSYIKNRAVDYQVLYGEKNKKMYKLSLEIVALLWKFRGALQADQQDSDRGYGYMGNCPPVGLPTISKIPLFPCKQLLCPWCLVRKAIRTYYSVKRHLYDGDPPYIRVDALPIITEDITEYFDNDRRKRIVKAIKSAHLEDRFKADRYTVLFSASQPDLAGPHGLWAFNYIQLSPATEFKSKRRKVVKLDGELEEMQIVYFKRKTRHLIKTLTRELVYNFNYWNDFRVNYQFLSELLKGKKFYCNVKL